MANSKSVVQWNSDTWRTCEAVDFADCTPDVAKEMDKAISSARLALMAAGVPESNIHIVTRYDTDYLQHIRSLVWSASPLEKYGESLERNGELQNNGES